MFARTLPVLHTLLAAALLDAAKPHCMCRWLVKIDVTNFFESISEIMVYEPSKSSDFKGLSRSNSRGYVLGWELKLHLGAANAGKAAQPNTQLSPRITAGVSGIFRKGRPQVQCSRTSP